ncbi:MAG: orotidine-5'-phosphate decarboxylase, partial [Planctomycetota bacterium]
MPHFADSLANAVQEKGSSLVVGLDPRWGQLPAELTADAGSEPSLQAQADAYQRFSMGVIDAVAETVAVVKPQMAFFEELGPAGMAALAEVVRYAQQRGLLAVLDGKRNDIGSTATAYARGLLGRDSPWGGDALT